MFFWRSNIIGKVFLRGRCVYVVIVEEKTVLFLWVFRVRAVGVGSFGCSIGFESLVGVFSVFIRR